VTGRQSLLLVLLALPSPLPAQLLAPGKLAAPHASLDGIRNCTSCHVLGSAGAADDRCLTCHELIRTRVAARKGYHPGLRDQSCAACHKDHFGRDFALVRFDTASFDHAKAGWTLQGTHATAVECRECHRASLVRAADVRSRLTNPKELAKTFLGLDTTCESCHEADGPHGAQFDDRRCRECHLETEWTDLARFDHAHTRYPLTGLHRRVTCEQCHKPTSRTAGSARYRGISFNSCASCHTDPHAGAMGKDCSACHATGGWNRIDGTVLRDRFDHSTTSFALLGSHATLDCAACHERTRPSPRGIRMSFLPTRTPSSLARPNAEQCGSCHVDYHDGVFAQGGSAQRCEGCHGQDAWLPTSYGIERHNREATFSLTGAHLVSPCTACHAGATAAAPPVFRLPDRDCVACHAQHDPHAGQFGAADCATCHDTRAFTPSTFDHATARFALDGAHAKVTCESCHPKETVDGRNIRRYRPLPRECRNCHGGAP